MTRAEKWLIVTAAGDLGKDGESWYDIIRQGMIDVGAEPWLLPGGPGLRYELGDWSGPIQRSGEKNETQSVDVPPYFTRSAPVPLPGPDPLSPSQLGGAKALAGDAGRDEEAAKRRGTCIHLLLEHLPKFERADWRRIAENLLRTDDPQAAPNDMDDMLAEAVRVLDSAELGSVFASETLAEVPFTANLGQARLSGVIDRLIVTPDAVTAVDFKTNMTVPEHPQLVPDGLLRQMGAYAHALAQIYPDKRIDTAILWTRTAQLMPLPHDLVTNALAASGHLDASAHGP